MRIVGGKYRAKRLAAPKDESIRPTSDRARQALFNILAHGRHGLGADGMDGIAVLDVFAGTGALGLEALSRGAGMVSFIDVEFPACRLIKRNAAALGAAEEVDIQRRDALDPGPAPRGHALIFLDPPYGEGLGPAALTALAREGWLAPGALCILELARKESFEPPDGFELLDRRNYGAAAIAFLRYAAP